MFDTFYPHKFIMNKTVKGEHYDCVRLFTFRDSMSNRYVFEAEEYPFDFYAVKFYLKANALSDKRYNIMTNLHNAPRVIRTCLNIMLDIHRENSNASFGFIGARNTAEKSTANTKRFRVYRLIMGSLFSPHTFSHILNEEKSFYLLVNRTNPTENLAANISSFIEEHYRLM